MLTAADGPQALDIARHHDGEIHLLVTDAVMPHMLAISSLTAKREPNGQPAVVARVRDTGGRALDLSGGLILSQGPGGLSAGPFPAQLGTTIAPGQSEPVTFKFNRQLPDGPWKALVHLESGSPAGPPRPPSPSPEVPVRPGLKQPCPP